ncbi:MAG: D-amino-acid transaminase [Bauldia litoralis]
MSRIAYVNGRYVPHADASVHIEDRGYQFADGVYEVVAVTRGRLVDELPHLDRLDRSLRELRIAAPMSRAALRTVLREVVRRNRVTNGIVYLQVTRGAAPRDHAFPKGGQLPALVVTARCQAPKRSQQDDGVAVITVPDIRWKRCDIKSVSLLPNVLAKQNAVEAGAYEAWQIAADGCITEGSATNAWIVSGDRALVTRPADESILDGITRRTVIDIAARNGYRLEERGFTLEEAKRAAECFLTSTTSWVMPVTSIDGDKISGGTPGPLSRALLSHYADYVDSLA